MNYNKLYSSKTDLSSQDVCSMFESNIYLIRNIFLKLILNIGNNIQDITL